MAQKNARIQLFEPNELLSAKLKRLFRSNPGVVVNNFGLGSENTESTLYIPFYRKWMFDGLASFDQRAAMDWLRDRIFFYRDTLLTVHKSACRVRKLDDLKLAPFLIKLDVQGYEFRALKGGEETIKAHEPILLIESPDSDVMHFLTGLHYEFYCYEHGKFVRGTIGKLNTFFMTEKKSQLVENYIEHGQGRVSV